MTVDDIKRVLADISFAPSCVDMGWKWEVEPILVRRDENGPSRDGYRLRTTFQRPDRDSKDGKLLIGTGRWWIVPQDTTVSGVVKTAFAAAKMILEHELMESFKWQGNRVFDPHNSVEALASLSSRQ